MYYMNPIIHNPSYSNKIYIIYIYAMNYTHKPSKNIHKSSIIPNEMGLFFSMNPMFFLGTPTVPRTWKS